MNFYMIIQYSTLNFFLSKIIETGSINIFLLLLVIIHFLKDPLIFYLKNRKKNIIKKIRYSKVFLYTARQKNIQIQQEILQIFFILIHFKLDISLKRKFLFKGMLIQIKKVFSQNLKKILKVINLEQQKILLNIKQQIVSIIILEGI
uniref:ATP synthase CF0 subunit I n=1 Tax=Nitzschia alba TaxID=2858 RepID=A0A5C0F2N2_NITAL|nr:ATP synthase CF0 subunit I [Nitzschia alba]QEI59616.1 ATP synthase CF0 subunit I [Nitzschia alba]